MHMALTLFETFLEVELPDDAKRKVDEIKKYSGGLLETVVTADNILGNKKRTQWGSACSAHGSSREVRLTLALKCPNSSRQ